MSGGESRPPAIRARFGVLGHSKTASAVFNRINWNTDTHRKRIKAIRKIINGGGSRRRKQPKEVTLPPEEHHPWFTK